MKQAWVFADGGYSHQRKLGAWAVIVRRSGMETMYHGACEAHGNGRMEVYPVVVGLSSLEKPCKVIVISDAKYVVNGINVWMKGWAKSWPKRIKHQDLWREIWDLAQVHQVSAKWVRGHNGHVENEWVDKQCSRNLKKIKKDGREFHKTVVLKCPELDNELETLEYKEMKQEELGL